MSFHAEKDFCPVSPTRKMRRKVTFNHAVAIIDVESVVGMSPEQVSAVWYTVSDYESIKASLHETLRMMKMDSIEDTHDVCTRGLGTKSLSYT